MVKVPVTFQHYTIEVYGQLLTAAHREPPSKETQENPQPSRCHLCNPVIHATLSRVAGDKLSQRGPQETLQDSNEDESIDDGTGTASLDLGHDSEPEPGPGDSRGRSKPDQG